MESMRTLTDAISALFRAIKLSDIVMDSKATTIQTYSTLKTFKTYEQLPLPLLNEFKDAMMLAKHRAGFGDGP